MVIISKKSPLAVIVSIVFALIVSIIVEIFEPLSYFTTAHTMSLIVLRSIIRFCKKTVLRNTDCFQTKTVTQMCFKSLDEADCAI